MILTDYLRKLDQDGFVLLKKILSEKKVRLIKKKRYALVALSQCHAN